MAEDFTYKLEGADEIEKALSDLPTKLSLKLLQSFNRKATKKFVVDPLRACLPYSAETKKGITVMNDRTDKTKVFAGIASNKFWVRWAEKGTKQRVTKKGASRGQIIGKNRAVPIIENSTDPIINYANKELGNEIANFLQKRIKKMK
jgi:hypothetical protein